MSLTFRPLAGQFGAEVVGIPPDLAVDDVQMCEIVAAWHRHAILLFRGLDVTPEQHIAFSRRLGPLHIMTPLTLNLPAHPEVFVVSNERDGAKEIGLKRAGEGFHTDGEDKAVPNAGSMLYAKKVPPERGDTLFVDMSAAYAALPADIKARLSGRRARFSRIDLHHVHYPLMAPLTERQKQERPDVWHPILRRHPHTGRTSLYIGRWAVEIDGVPEAEGRQLLDYLQAFAQRPAFLYRHAWRVGDAVLWDNRCTQHCATGFDDQRYVRTMYRTTLEGEVPLMAAD